MKILWELYEIAINFFQGFIFTYFAFDFLGDKRQRSYVKSHGALYGTALAAVISIMNYLMFFEHLYAFAYIAVIFIYSLRELKGSMLSKIFASVFPILIMAAVSAFTANFAAVLFKTDLYTILTNNNIERFVSVFATQLIILYCIIVFLRASKINKVSKALAVTEWILIAAVLIISMIICALINFMSFELDSKRCKLYSVIVFGGVILINVVAAYMVIDLGKKNKAVLENEVLKVQNDYNKQYISNIQREYDVIRKLRHDFKDSYSLIHTLISEGKFDKALKYIEDSTETLSGMEVFIRTNNDVLNAVINSKFTAAKSYGIECDCVSVNEIDGISDYDLCSLLSNMLENAITACAEIENRKRLMHLSITSDGFNYIFNLKNTIESSVLKNNLQLVTSKKLGEGHGLGIRIIRDISKKYDGRCDFYEEDDCFCCNVILARK